MPSFDRLSVVLLRTCRYYNAVRVASTHEVIATRPIAPGQMIRLKPPTPRERQVLPANTAKKHRYDVENEPWVVGK